MSAAFLPNGIVTLLTDFGTADGYAGAMKGVLFRRSREQVVDLAHDVPPRDVVRGALALAAAAPWFPAGTVHVAVVDPGVGTDRAGVVVLAGGHALVGPDNGLLVPAAERLSAGGDPARAFAIGSHAFLPRRIAPTFHGRDVFAPTAAALAGGDLAPEDVGPPHTLLPGPAREVSSPAPGVLEARVLFADRFGNCLTTARKEDLPKGRLACLLPGGARVPFLRTYGDAAPGEPLSLLGSEGWLEVAVRDGSAADSLGLRPGDLVSVVVEGGPEPSGPPRRPPA